jgi:hypothetical protein
MVLVKILMVGVAVAVLMGVAQAKHWPQRAGVVGRCTVINQPSSGGGGTWYSCKQGILNGFPALEGDSCQSKGLVQHREIWACPAPLASLPGS